MKNNGIIPPHFLYFLENEEIEVTNFKSGDFNNPLKYDRAVVKFPFINTTFDIQVIFDNLDYSLPPDFVPLVNCDQLVISYSTLVKNWNFRESSSLYYAIKTIKDEYCNIMTKKVYNFLANQNASNYNDNQNEPPSIYMYLYDWLNYFMNKTKSLEVLMNLDKKNDFIFSYCIDIEIRSRIIDRKPILIIAIDSKNMCYTINLKVPKYISIENLGLKFNEVFKDIVNFKNIISKYELNILEYFQKMSFRENLSQRILNMSNLNFSYKLKNRYWFSIRN